MAPFNTNLLKVFCGGFFIVYVTETLVQSIFSLNHSHSHGLPTSEAPFPQG